MFRNLFLLGALLFPSMALAGPNTVAILYFENQGNDQLEPLKVGLAQMLITDVQGAEGLTVVERSQLQAILDELELGHSGKVAPDTAAKVGKLLGAEWMVMGSYFELMGTLRIDTRVVKVETSEIIHAEGVNGGVNEFMRMEDELANGLKNALATQMGKSPAPAAPAAEPNKKTRGGDGTGDAGSGRAPTETAHRAKDPAVLKPDEEALGAAVAFSEGLIYLDKKDVGRARESFEKAVAANPKLEVAKAELANMDL